jgi:hypothetical protein
MLFKLLGAVVLSAAVSVCYADTCDNISGSWFGDGWQSGHYFFEKCQNIKQAGGTHIQLTCDPNHVTWSGTCSNGKIDVTSIYGGHLTGTINSTPEINLDGTVPGATLKIILYKYGTGINQPSDRVIDGDQSSKDVNEASNEEAIFMVKTIATNHRE